MKFKNKYVNEIYSWFHKTVLDLAEERGYTNIINVLKTYKSNNNKINQVQ